jgi:hypothetical protein
MRPEYRGNFQPILQEDLTGRRLMVHQGAGPDCADSARQRRGGARLRQRTLETTNNLERGPVMTAPAISGNWNYPTKVKFGAGRIAELPTPVGELGMKRPLIVTDPAPPRC